MTVPVQTPYTGAIANGLTTEFPYGFKIASEEDLAVAVDGVLQSSWYTVSGVGDPAGGNVTFSVAPTNGQKVLLYLAPVPKRETDYQQFGDWLAEIVNLDFDRIWLTIQTLQQNDIRSLKLPVDTASDQVILDDAAARANKGIKFDAYGNLILSNFDPDLTGQFESSAAASATAAATSATTATTKATAAATSETNALASKNEAGTSATNAANSAAVALASKNAASTSENNSAASAASALASKNAASISESNAATSATNAANSATNAAVSATNAAASATAAASAGSITFPIPVSSGGTGGTSRASAVAALGLEAAEVVVTTAGNATTDIGAAASSNILLTTTVATITGFAAATAGVRRNVRVSTGGITLTNSASFVLPGGANIVAAAGDCFEVESLGGGTWVIAQYQRASGEALIVTKQAPEPIGIQTFTASGVFTVPDGVTKVYVTGIGGGGNGGSSGPYVGSGSGGGSGDQCYRTPIAVTPGQNVTVTIAAAGGTTSFGAAITLAGGGHGASNTYGGAGGGVFGSYGSPSSGSSNGGSGAPGLFGRGVGGGGPSADNGPGVAGKANTGAGGGGGGLYNTGAAGGAGGTGILIVEW